MEMKKVYSRRCILIILSITVFFGLLMMLFFSGKYHIELITIAVSSDEEFIACFEIGNGPVIRCFRAEGSLAFNYEVPSNVSAGGYCTLWFEGNELCALFYRTEKIARFAMDGTIISIAENTTQKDPPKFPFFTKCGYQQVFHGQKIDVVYNKKSFLGYWILGAERYLEITPKGSPPNIIYSWSAKSGIEH